MGWIAAAWDTVTRALSPSPPFVLELEPAATFASTESAPRPIDQVLAAMSGLSNTRVGRTEALQVAAVQRGRNELCAIGTLPLRLFNGLNIVQHPLFRQTDPDVPNIITMAQTIEDLIFEGAAWWRVISRDFDLYPVAARYVPYGKVQLRPPADQVRAPNPTGLPAPGKYVWIDGEQVPIADMIRFDSPNPGLLTACARSVRRALLLDQLAAMYAESPRPLDYFTTRSGTLDVEPMSETDQDVFLAEWEAARRMRATGWIPENVERVDVSTPSPADLQLVQLQQQVSLEIANGLGVDPEDLGVSTTSRTYFNAQDRRQEKVNRTYAPYMRAITDRLTMGDVTRRGYEVRFDLSDYLRADPATQILYWEGLQRMRVASTEWIADQAGISQDRMPAPDAAPPAPAALPAGQSSQRISVQLDAGPRTFTVDAPTQRFSADVERRTISGLALPYGKVARKYGISYRFLPGSLEWSDVSRVKHLKDHITPIGVAKSITSTAEGLEVTLGVSDGIEGSREKAERDQLLFDAAEGLYDGLSVGVDFQVTDDPDTTDAVYNETDGVYDVRRASLQEVSTTPLPAFADARVTKVAASRDGGNMPCPNCGHQHAPGVSCHTAAQRAQEAAAQFHQPTTPAPGTPSPAPTPTPAPAPSGPEQVTPQARFAATEVREPAPYVFDRTGHLRAGTHDFSTDLFNGWSKGDLAAKDRASTFVREAFAVTPANVASLNPTINRPDMYVDQLDYTSPIWEAINKGTLTNQTPFTVPKFSASSGLVADHVTGTEPTPGAFSATVQTITPTGVSGKVEVTREAWDQGGNPQMSGLIWRQMVRGYREALEAYAVAQLVAVAASMTDIVITTAAADSALDQALAAALVPLRYIRGGDRFTDVFTQVDLYSALAKAKDTAGRPLYPEINPQNAAGTQNDGSGLIQARGKNFWPAWATAATSINASSSYMFNRDVVCGWASAPQRIDIEWRVAWVDIGIWGYKAFAVTDYTGTRELVYDPV
jgi:phage head maturation protease